jgi:FkbM family methyltransferase
MTIVGFVQTSPGERTVDELPVVDWATLQTHHGDAQIVLGIFNRDMPQNHLITLALEHGFAPPVLPQQLFELVAPAMGWRYWLASRSHLVSHMPRVAGLAARLADEESRTTLFRVVAFRLGLDAAFSSVRSADPQYFNRLTIPHLLRRAAPLTYIDGGAFDGDSYRQLREIMAAGCQLAILLEPDPANYAALVQSVAGDPAALCLPAAVSDRHALLSFSGGQGEASAVGAAGGSQVVSLALDDVLPFGRADFIKLDVEGGELAALMGARRLIVRERPLLAFSLYHRPEDLWVLPELLQDLCEGYDLYVRQHQYNSFDLVCYAIPNTT